MKSFLLFIFYISIALAGLKICDLLLKKLTTFTGGRKILLYCTILIIGIASVIFFYLAANNIVK